jgi:hypothetical protein
MQSSTTMYDVYISNRSTTQVTQETKWINDRTRATSAAQRHTKPEKFEPLGQDSAGS